MISLLTTHPPALLPDVVEAELWERYALRGALTPQWGLVALGLLAAGAAHYADLLLRLRRKG